jgi:hypothetical protein
VARTLNAAARPARDQLFVLAAIESLDSTYRAILSLSTFVHFSYEDNVEHPFKVEHTSLSCTTCRVHRTSVANSRKKNRYHQSLGQVMSKQVAYLFSFQGGAMNPRTMPASSPPPNAGFPGDSQDLFSLGMDWAIEIEKASLATVISLNSCVLDIYKNALWFTPASGNLLDMASRALAFSMELQTNWLTVLAPHASSHVATQGRQAQPTADELAYSMDIAIGAQFEVPSSTVAGSSGVQAQPTADAPESNIAIGARA